MYLLLVSLSVGAVACNRSAPLDAGAGDSFAEASPIDDASSAADDASLDARAPLPLWPKDLPPASAWQTQAGEGRRSVRAIVHAHSVHSHDACDGAPYVDGGVNEPCLQSFRRALCRTRVDAVFITEHSALMAEGPFERVLQLRAGDRAETEGGRTVGYHVQCDGAYAGHSVMVLPGAENELMPIALREHPQTLPGMDLVATYRTASVESVARFQAAGGFVVIPHAEQKEIPFALSLHADGTELYNIHANLDPRIAGPYLGVDIGAFFGDLPRFTDTRFGTEPDLAFLGVFHENVPDLQRWSALWRDGQRVIGVAGSDAHENAIPRLFADGERGDSYRRVFRWFSNELIMEGALTRDSLLAALRASRGRVHFDAWGVAQGFQWRTNVGGATSLADGAAVSLAQRPTLEIDAPAVLGLDASLPAPAIRVRLFRADAAAATGWTEVASDPARIRHVVTQPGIYRAQADITPHHARPYLPRLERYVHEVPWVYAAPVVVTE